MEQPWKKQFQAPEAALIGAVVRTIPPNKHAKYIGTVEDVSEGCATVAFREIDIGRVILPMGHALELQVELRPEEFTTWTKHIKALEAKQEAVLERITIVYAAGPHPLLEKQQEQMSSLRQELEDSESTGLFLFEADKVRQKAECKGRKQFAEAASAARLEAAKGNGLVKVRAYGQDCLDNDLNRSALEACVAGDIERLRQAAAGCFGTVVTFPTGAWANYRHEGFQYGTVAAVLDARTFGVSGLDGSWGNGDTLLGLVIKVSEVVTGEQRQKWVQVAETLEDIGVPEAWVTPVSMVYTLRHCSEDGSVLLQSMSGSEVQVPSLAGGPVYALQGHLEQMLWMSMCREDVVVKVLGAGGRLLNGHECLTDALCASVD